MLDPLFRLNLSVDLCGRRSCNVVSAPVLQRIEKKSLVFLTCRRRWIDRFLVLLLFFLVGAARISAQGTALSS